MYQNDKLKIAESDLRTLAGSNAMNAAISYIEVLVESAELEATAMAKKALIHPEHNIEALLKRGVCLGYENILNRFEILRKNK